MTTDPDGPLPPEEVEAIARLRSAAAHAENVDWPLTAGDVIGGETASRRPGPSGWSRVVASPRARLATTLAVAAAIVVVFLVPFPLVHLGGTAKQPSSPGARQSKPAFAGCVTTVHGVLPERSSVTAGYLPPGFRIVTAATVPPGSGSSTGVVYRLASGHEDPPRIEVTLSNLPGPLTWQVGGRRTARNVRIQRRAALIETGAPSPAWVGVYWKVGPSSLVSVVGYKLTAATVLEVAQHVDAVPGGVVSLPTEPGRIVSRQKAIAVAGTGHVTATAKLSSWTEVLTLLQASGHYTGKNPLPAELGQTPWKPIWAVLLVPEQSGRSDRTQGPAFVDRLVLVDAATGTKELTVPSWTTSWFASLSDRDPSLEGCPGGSSARVPFGVLTRDEEAHAVGELPESAMVHLPASIQLKLTTVPALNRADPALYGGCVEQSCSIDELVWPTIAVIRAPAGRTLSCPPPWAKGPAGPSGGRSSSTKQYFVISVPDNFESGCGPLPAWVSRLQDLAPASLPPGAPSRHVAPLANTAATPRGWSPIAYGNLQISVPSSWLVEDPGYSVDGDVPGTVFVGEAPARSSRALPPNLVSFTTARVSPVAHARAVLVNGVHATLGWTKPGGKTTYLERALGMEVTVSGPFAQRILQTTTHSPLSVVLGSGVVGTPPGWRTVSFGGLRFAVPGTWRIERDSWWGGCPGDIEPYYLRLSTARTLSLPSCPAPPPTAAHVGAVPGVVLGAGPQVSGTGSPTGSCLSRVGLRICLEPPPFGGGFEAGRQLDLLTALVYLPGRTVPDQVEIGLFGSGLVPLQIFDSLRPSGD